MRTFISYARQSPDMEVAVRLYQDLEKAGHYPWLDVEDLLPGDDWPSRIEAEIKECKQFIALLSSRALSKRGYVQKELRTALDVLDTIPVDVRFLIPVRLDECEPRDAKLKRLQRLDLFPDYAAGLPRLLRALDEGRRIPGRLWIKVGLEIPPDIATWPDGKLFRFIREDLLPEARERAQRDYEYVPTRDYQEAVRKRTVEKLFDVARRFGFLDGLERCLEQDQRKGWAGDEGTL